MTDPWDVPLQERWRREDEEAAWEEWRWREEDERLDEERAVDEADAAYERWWLADELAHRRSVGYHG